MLFSHPRTHPLCLEAEILLSSRPSNKPAALQSGKSALAAVRVYHLWSISQAVLPHLILWMLRHIALGGRRALGLVPEVWCC